MNNFLVLLIINNTYDTCVWHERVKSQISIIHVSHVTHINSKTLVATVGILNLFFEPKFPNYSTDRSKINDLRLNFDTTLRVKFDVKITSNGPNKKIEIHYKKRGKLSVWYTKTKLCSGSLPNFYQVLQNKTALNVALTCQPQYGNALLTAVQEQQKTG